jgi:hypothetical protein
MSGNYRNDPRLNDIEAGDDELLEAELADDEEETVLAGVIIVG